MNYWFILVCIIFGVTAGQALPIGPFVQCSYTGDPHLLPFPPGPSQSIKMYFCNKNRWEILLQNTWVSVIVKVGPSPYVILDYLVIFYDGSTGINCVLIGSSGLSTCPFSSSIISITNLLGTAWSHWYPAGQFLNLQITSYLWGTGKRYDIVVRETQALVNQSTGLCVKNDCPVESIISQLPPIVIKVCDLYIGAAQKQYRAGDNDYLVDFVRTACHNDLIRSFDLKLAQTVVPLLIHSSLVNLNSDNFRNTIMKAEGNIQEALVQADALAERAIQQDKICWEQEFCLAKNNN